jgi:hypothetical protein
MSEHAEDTRLYSMAYVRLCKGDHKAALLLAQLVYWWPKKRASQKGVKKSCAEWQTELMLSEKEVARINKLLKALGLIEIYQAPWGHFKSISTFYVLTDKVLAIAPLPKVGVVQEEALPPKGGVVTKASPPKVGITENTTSLTENTKANTNSVPASPGTNTACAEELKVQPGKTEDDNKWVHRVRQETGEDLKPEQCKWIVDTARTCWKHLIDFNEVLGFVFTRDQWGYKNWSLILTHAINDFGLHATVHTSGKYDKPCAYGLCSWWPTIVRLMIERKKEAAEETERLAKYYATLAVEEAKPKIVPVDKPSSITAAALKLKQLASPAHKPVAPSAPVAPTVTLPAPSQADTAAPAYEVGVVLREDVVSPEQLAAAWHADQQAKKVAEAKATVLAGKVAAPKQKAYNPHNDPSSLLFVTR